MVNPNDPAAIPYVITEDDGVLWYVAYKEKNPGVPYITVSAKGVANGLSTEYNDGYDFGPDSYNPNISSGIPVSQTSGIQEAWNYALGNPVNYTPASGLYYIPKIHFESGAYDIYAPITINPPVYTHSETNVNGNNNYTIGNIIIKGQGSMNPYLINHVTTDYMITLNPDNVINTNIQMDNFQIQNAYGVTAYGHINLDFSSVNSNINIFQSINLDVNGGTTHPPLNIVEFESINLWNYELYMSESSTSPASVFVAYYKFSAQSCSFNGDQIYAVDIISISGSRINYAGISQYGLIFPSGYLSNTPIPKITIDESFINFPLAIGIDIGSLNITHSTLGYTESATYLLQAISGTSPTIVKLSIKDNASENFRPSSFPPISTGITINEFDIGSVVNNTGNNFPHDFTVDGTTAGTITGHYVEYSTNYKKLIFAFSGYENDTTTAQTIDFPLAFATSALISANNTGLTISATTSGITITAPDSTTTYSGIVIVEGY